jgi:hypothetical protein
MNADELRESRRKRACDSILENESLTEGLDDVCAGVLLDWILPDVERISDSAENFVDGDSAPATVETDLKKVRKFMRLVSGLVSGGSGGQSAGACAGEAEDFRESELSAALYTPEDLSGGLVHDVAGLCAALRSAMEARESGR